MEPLLTSTLAWRMETTQKNVVRAGTPFQVLGRREKQFGREEKNVKAVAHLQIKRGQYSFRDLHR